MLAHLKINVDLDHMATLEIDPNKNARSRIMSTRLTSGRVCRSLILLVDGTLAQTGVMSTQVDKLR